MPLTVTSTAPQRSFNGDARAEKQIIILATAADKRKWAL